MRQIAAFIKTLFLSMNPKVIIITTFKLNKSVLFLETIISEMVYTDTSWRHYALIK